MCELIHYYYFYYYFQCNCTARYAGKNCEIDTGPPCYSNPCNSGLCIEDNRGDYTCNCLPGYTGTQCETEISVHPLCESKPCFNDGICKVAVGSSRIECICAKGWTGSRCEVKLSSLFANSIQVMIFSVANSS